MADSRKRDTWLVAVWPGMGSVAITAGAYLMNKLGARLVRELPPREVFDVKHVEVKGGLARVGRMPRSMIFEWTDAESDRDLIIFIGEAQPETGGYRLCHRILDYAQERGVTRVFTFAAMATQLHPSNDPRVFGVATDRTVLAEIQGSEVEVLKEGRISGLNGILLAAGAERGIPGVSLLGELPFFAVGVPNPKASQAVLQVFTKLAGITLDFTELARQADAMEDGLLKLLEKMKESARQEQEPEEDFSVPEFESDQEGEEEEADAEPQLDYGTRARIESMFEAARQDRERAFKLKEELDRLGVFKQYEDRFLDLFKSAD